MLRAEPAEIFWFVHQLVIFWGTLVANYVNKNLPSKFGGARRQFAGEQLPPVPFPSYMPVCPAFMDF